MSSFSLLILASLICAILYRLGGIGNPFRSWMRDWLIPPIIYFIFILFKQPEFWYGHLLLIPAIMLTGFALTTYWDDLFGGEDNFYMYGFMVGLGAFPLYWLGVPWFIILSRAIIIAILVGGLNWFVHKYQIKYSDWVEELSRGFIICLSIYILTFLNTGI